MKIPQSLPITVEQSRASRFQLGLTQKEVIEESELPGYKLKQFETGRFIPDMPFLQKLREYYESKGIELGAPASQPNSKQKPGSSMTKTTARMCFYVSDDISEDQADAILSRMDANDDRIAEILPEAVSSGFLSDYDADTEQRQRELFGAMAENYLLFRMLQGRNIVSPPKPGEHAQTQADLLSQFFANSPLSTANPRDASLNADDSEDSDSTEDDEEFQA